MTTNETNRIAFPVFGAGDAGFRGEAMAAIREDPPELIIVEWMHGLIRWRELLFYPWDKELGVLDRIGSAQLTLAELMLGERRHLGMGVCVYIRTQSGRTWTNIRVDHLIRILNEEEEWGPLVSRKNPWRNLPCHNTLIKVEVRKYHNLEAIRMET